MNTLGDEEGPASMDFASAAEADAMIAVSRPAPEAARPITHPVPGRTIDLRWWLAALAFGALLWAVILYA